MADSAVVGARKDEEDSKLWKIIGEMSRAAIEMANCMPDAKDSEKSKNLVRSQIEEEMKETKVTFIQTSKCVEESRKPICW